jgi:pyruvate,orthophosphate dikinase
MPGMLDTVLNLGLNDSTVEALAKARAIRVLPDSYRRFIQMYAAWCGHRSIHIFEEILEYYKENKV